jgi:hypothetical protein
VRGAAGNGGPYRDHPSGGGARHLGARRRTDCKKDTPDREPTTGNADFRAFLPPCSSRNQDAFRPRNPEIPDVLRRQPELLQIRATRWIPSFAGGAPPCFRESNESIRSHWVPHSAGFSIRCPVGGCGILLGASGQRATSGACFERKRIVARTWHRVGRPTWPAHRKCAAEWQFIANPAVQLAPSEKEPCETGTGTLPLRQSFARTLIACYDPGLSRPFCFPSCHDRYTSCLA